VLADRSDPPRMTSYDEARAAYRPREQLRGAA
jgi:hypothetical protein